MNHVFRSFTGNLVIFIFTARTIRITSLKFSTRWENKNLYANMECEFLINNMIFLGYVVSKESVKIDPSNVEAICSWPEHKTTQEIRSLKASLRSIGISSMVSTPLLLRSPNVWRVTFSSGQWRHNTTLNHSKERSQMHMFWIPYFDELLKSNMALQM